MSVKTIITDGGLELLRAAPNHKLVYTKAVCGSGSVAGTQLAELTDVADYVMDLSIVDVKPTETAATLRLQLDNSKAPREFQLFQIGILAKLMDGDTEIIGERLLQVMQYDAPDIVRAIPHVSEYVVNTLMGQAETVEGIIDHAAYVSIRQHKEIVNELQAKIAAQQLELDSHNENDKTLEAKLNALSNKIAMPALENVPLVEGFVAYIPFTYHKNISGEVTVTGEIWKGNNVNFTDREDFAAVGVLPPSFRPKNNTRARCVLRSSAGANSQFLNGFANIDPDGIISLGIGQIGTIPIRFAAITANFLAADV